ncbi:MAG: ribosomal RNA small subunit methyltransferase A [Candidatus Manganitrophaceae bacterium]|nr:MAG: ribosomal RNA small subunit methyltransferase A [Candidatus Manganitrophaceae bacterium]
MTETTPRPRKSWGQNFLIDHNIQRKILDAAEVQPGERIVEIGPGRGILTKGLLERGAELLAVEIDPLLVAALRQEISSPHFNLIQEDALHYPYHRIPSPYKVVANLPYYLSTPLLFRLLEERERISRMVLMLQREVAERLVSPVGGKNYGVLSVMVQLYAEVRIGFHVSRGCFRPRPDVDSSVIVLTPLPRPRVPVKDEALFGRIVRGAFGHRRKRLANALADAGFQRTAAEAALQKIGIDPARRGETLSLGEFALLADTLFD